MISTMTWNRCFRSAACWIALLGGVAAAPALAQFDVPDNCRTGTGTYSGDMEGEVTYRICQRGTRVDTEITFFGELPVEASSIEDDEDKTLRSDMISAEGEIEGWSEFLTGPRLSRTDFTAQFDDCGLTGTWQVAYTGRTTTGTFTMTGTGNADCGGTTAPSTAMCGATGGFGLAMPLLLCLIGRPRSRTCRRR